MGEGGQRWELLGWRGSLGSGPRSSLVCRPEQGNATSLSLDLLICQMGTYSSHLLCGCGDLERHLMGSPSSVSGTVWVPESSAVCVVGEGENFGVSPVLVSTRHHPFRCFSDSVFECVELCPQKGSSGESHVERQRLK